MWAANPGCSSLSGGSFEPCASLRIRRAPAQSRPLRAGGPPEARDCLLMPCVWLIAPYRPKSFGSARTKGRIKGQSLGIRLPGTAADTVVCACRALPGEHSTHSALNCSRLQDRSPTTEIFANQRYSSHLPIFTAPLFLVSLRPWGIIVDGAVCHSSGDEATVASVCHWRPRE